MIYLVLAILCSSLLSIIMRLSERYIGENVSMLAFNYITCTILSLVYSGVGNIFPSEKGLGLTLGMGLINGFLYLGGFVLLQVNVKRIVRRIVVDKDGNVDIYLRVIGDLGLEDDVLIDNEKTVPFCYDHS